MQTFTTPSFWDCECAENYIHPARFDSCPVCGAHRDEQPDARADEVKAEQDAGRLEVNA